MGRKEGVPGFDLAKLCFLENLEDYINPNTDPDKYDLNKGLYNLAIGLQALEAKVDAMRREIATR